MSDSKNPDAESTAGDPVVEPNDGTESASVDEVVERAQEGLADADAFRGDVVAAAAPVSAAEPAESATPDAPQGVTNEAQSASTAEPGATSAEPAVSAVPTADAASADEASEQISADERAAAAAAVAAMNDDDDTPWYDRPGVDDATGGENEYPAAPALPMDSAAETTALPAEEAPTVAAPSVEATPVVAPLAGTTAAPELAPENSVLAGPSNTVFVQAPEPPRKRGNRGFAGVVGLIATVVFAIGYLAAVLLQGGLDKISSGDALLEATRGQVGSWTFWVPIAVFFLGFWLLGAFLNTAKWGYWVVFGLLVGVVSLLGVMLSTILAAGPSKIAFSEGLDLARAAALSIPGFVAFFLGRELPVWFGGWIARRGRTVIAANAAAEEEYERTLEAGPQIAQ